VLKDKDLEFANSIRVFAAQSLLVISVPPAIAFAQQSQAQRQAEQGYAELLLPDHGPERHAIEAKHKDEEHPGQGCVLLHPPSCCSGGCLLYTRPRAP
jgi:hypothetical protein